MVNAMKKTILVELLVTGLGSVRGLWVMWSGRAFLIAKERPVLFGG